MSRISQLHVDSELDQLREEEQQLLQREKEYEASRQRLAEARSERDSLIPPLSEIQLRVKQRQHEQVVSRREVKNELRTQNHSLLMLLLLVTATCTLVWWGFQLMQGS